MPLTAPTQRKKVHAREVKCEVFERDDGLWDVEGHMTDIKPFDWPNRDRGGIIPAGEPLHGMSLRLTMDLDFKIHAVEAVIDYAPHQLCGDIVDVFKQLEGATIGRGWSKLIKERFSGVKGCTHLRELLGPIATSAFQGLFKPRRDRDRAPQETREEETRLLVGSVEVLNTCHAWDTRGPIVKDFWPQYYQPDD